MTAILNIVGFELQMRLLHSVQSTVLTLKEAILTLYGIPVARQSLFIHSTPMLDELRLADYISEYLTALVNVELRVTRDEGPILVTLDSQQFVKWKPTVRCREATTVGEFKRLVADELRWVGTDGMQLYRRHGQFETRLDEEGTLDQPVRDWLVIDGTKVFVVFTDNVPQNGHTLPAPPLPR